MNEFHEECLEKFNKIGIFGGMFLGRLVGYLVDDQDNYYIIRKEDGELSYCSMVGRFTPLEIKDFGYENRVWDFSIPSEESFIFLDEQTDRWYNDK